MRTRPETLQPFLSLQHKLTYTQTLRVNTTPTYTQFINLISFPCSSSRFSFCTALLCVDFCPVYLYLFVFLFNSGELYEPLRLFYQTEEFALPHFSSPKVYFLGKKKKTKLSKSFSAILKHNTFLLQYSKHSTV